MLYLKSYLFEKQIEDVMGQKYGKDKFFAACALVKPRTLKLLLPENYHDNYQIQISGTPNTKCKFKKLFICVSPYRRMRWADKNKEIQKQDKDEKTYTRWFNEYKQQIKNRYEQT